MEQIITVLVLGILFVILIYHLLIKPFKESIEEILKTISKFLDLFRLATKKMSKSQVANIILDIVVFVGGIVGAFLILPEDPPIMRFAILIGIFWIVYLCLKWIITDSQNA